MNSRWFPFFLKFLVVLFMTGFSGRAYAYRPFTTEDAGVAGKGVAQLEVSTDYLRWDNGDEEGNLLLVPIYGITSWWEASLEIPWQLHDPQDEGTHIGIGDINVVNKFLVLKEGSHRPAVVLKGVVKTNSGNAGRGLGSGDLDYSIVAAASKGVGRVSLHAMFGFTFVGDNGEPNIRNIFVYGVAADFVLTERFHLVAEVNGKRHPDRLASSHPIDGLVGATYRISDRVTVDGGLRIGFAEAAPSLNTTLGASFTF